MMRSRLMLLRLAAATLGFSLLAVFVIWRAASNSSRNAPVATPHEPVAEKPVQPLEDLSPDMLFFGSKSGVIAVPADFESASEVHPRLFPSSKLAPIRTPDEVARMRKTQNSEPQQSPESNESSADESGQSLDKKDAAKGE